MTKRMTSERVWQEIEKEIFAVIGMVTAENQSRTVGVVYVVKNGRIYVASGKSAWKVRHISQNPNVSMTIPIHKSIPFLPWVKIPSATITFAGVAQILEPEETPTEIVRAIYRDMADNQDMMAGSCLIEVTTVKDFITYGVGTSLMEMRDPKLARGRVPVNIDGEQYPKKQKSI